MTEVGQSLMLHTEYRAALLYTDMKDAMEQAVQKCMTPEQKAHFGRLFGPFATQIGAAYIDGGKVQTPQENCLLGWGCLTVASSWFD